MNDEALAHWGGGGCRAKKTNTQKYFKHKAQLKCPLMTDNYEWQKKMVLQCL
jgi:hypothetical protein